MKRKVLSMLVFATVVISQVAMIPAVNAATTEDLSTENITINSIKKATVASVKEIKKCVLPDVVVDKDYDGENGNNVEGIPTYKNVRAAIESIDKKNAEQKTIFIKNGTYKEKLTISTPNITLIGESADDTILTYDDAAGTIKRTEDGGDGIATYGTTGSSSITIKSSGVNFRAANITISNTFDEATNLKGGQAVAMKNDSNMSIFVNCKFSGNQDTLYANQGNQYYYKCYIEGDVDFIFGGAQAVFKKCEIKSLNRDGSVKGYISAPSTQADKCGYLMLDCRLTSNITENNSVYLGRPWHPGSSTNVCSSVVYKHCYLGAHIKEDGWSGMSGNDPKDNFMYEYDNHGPGANTTNINRRQLTKEEADSYTEDKVLSGWNPNDIVKKLLSHKQK